MAKYLDDNGLLYYNQKLNAKFDDKVDKITGKGLSTNDFTTAEKTKLQGIEAEATKTIIDSALSASSTNPVQNKIINDALNGKVNVISGKGLSTNDYTTTEKNKLSGIETGAEVNIIESIVINGVTATITGKQASATIEAGAIDIIKVNGTAQTIVDKTVDITVPTNNNQLTNGAGYQNSTEVQTAINSAISGITSFDYQVVQSLPTTGVKGTIYLVPNSGTEPNYYDEYLWIVTSGTGKWEKIGTTAIDLSGYWSKTELVAITNAEIDTILAS